MNRFVLSPQRTWNDTIRRIRLVCKSVLYISITICVPFPHLFVFFFFFIPASPHFLSALSASETGFILVCVLWLSAAWFRGNINMCSLISQAPSSMTPPSLRRRKSLRNRNSSVNDCLHVIWLDFYSHIFISKFCISTSYLFIDPVSVFIVKLNRLHKRKQIHPATSAGAGWHLGNKSVADII